MPNVLHRDYDRRRDDRRYDDRDRSYDRDRGGGGRYGDRAPPAARLTDDAAAILERMGNRPGDIGQAALDTLAALPPRAQVQAAPQVHQAQGADAHVGAAQWP